MTDMPERMFAWLFLEDIQDASIRGGWTDVMEKRLQEYVRADLYRSLALDVVTAGGQASDAYEAQLKAEAMAEKLAETLALIADGHSWPSDHARDALAEYEDSK